MIPYSLFLYLIPQSGVLYAMRKRLYNSTYYHKPKPEQPREVGHHQAPDQDEDKLYQKLSEELNKRKLNTDAITQILELTFKKRRAVIEAITDTDVTQTVLQKFPFLDNGTTVSNTKKPVVLSSLHYFMSCSLVNPSVEPFEACRPH